MKNFDTGQMQTLKLVADLMEQSTKSTQNLTNSLMSGYHLDAVRAEAKLAVIHMQMGDLFASGFMPTQSAIFAALIPDEDLVETITEKRMQEFDRMAE